MKEKYRRNEEEWRRNEEARALGRETYKERCEIVTKRKPRKSWEWIRHPDIP